MSGDGSHDFAPRIPPQSAGAEQAVVGGLMLDPESLWKIKGLLTEDDFYRRDHRLIFRGILELNEKRKPFDAVTLGEWFDAHGLTEQIGGRGYLIELAATTPSAANIKAYAEIVHEKSMLRHMITAGTDVVNNAFEPNGQSAFDVLAKAQQRLNNILQSEPCELEPTQEVLRRMMEKAARRHELAGELDGLSTGYTALDDILRGLKGGQLIVLAGRPKMGKSTLAMNIAEAVAVTQKKRVAIHSLEMQADELIERSCCSVGRVPHNDVRAWNMSNETASRFTVASQRLADSEIVISRPRNVRVEQLIAQTRRAHAEKPLHLVVIDYLQLINMAGAERRDIGISEVTRQLKLMATELNIPVLLLSQLNRGLESRPDKRPNASDLRDGGSIEQDADIVIFVYRDEVYDKHSPDKGTAEIIVALQRSGPTGMVRLKSRLDICRFDLLEHDWTPEHRPAASEGKRAGSNRSFDARSRSSGET